MSVVLVPIKEIEQASLRAMMIDYFREIDKENITTVDGKEQLNYPYLGTYWTDTNRLPFFIRYDGQIVGFTLVNDWVVHRPFAADRAIAEFYVAPDFRRKSLGKTAAELIFNELPGKWEVRQSIHNIPAVTFWRQIIRDFTKGRFQEVTKEQEYIQFFAS